MTKDTVGVSTGGSIVDRVEVEVFESLDEAAEFLGQDVALRMVNAQHRADVTNKKRAEHTKVDPAEMRAFREWQKANVKK